MIRVLYLVQGLGVGGAEKQLLYLLRTLDRSRVAPTLAAFRAGGGLRPAFEAAGVPVFDLDIEFPIARIRNLSPVLRFLRWMQAERFDVLHAWLYHANILGVVLGRRAGIPTIILSERDIGYFHGRRHRLAGRLAYPRATYVTANTPPVVETLLRNRMARQTQIMMIPNGVALPAHDPTDSEIAETRRKFALAGDGPVIASVGRFASIKGHKHFIAAAPAVLTRFPQATFALAGEGECLAELQQQSRDLGIEQHVRFVGHVEDVAGFLAAVDVFVLPSLSEGLANALMEAMAMARPIVATAVGGNCELLEHERSGLLVPPGDPVTMADAIVTLLADRVRARALGRAAQARIRPYSVECMTRRVEELYGSPSST
ncbi:MAG TPA: glycosyltransferase [Verrucomicrobiae bacterium]|nr:glycosyltransferase [Verrucomicrobiae bacterium]